MSVTKALLSRCGAIGIILVAALLTWVSVDARETPPARRIEAVRSIDLPHEAQATLRLIKKGGPFPYARDGVFFQNRERNLPLRPRNYYREYTVPTPSAQTRGARRIISGQTAEYYYTDDHYRSFKRITE